MPSAAQRRGDTQPAAGPPTPRASAARPRPLLGTPPRRRPYLPVVQHEAADSLALDLPLGLLQLLPQLLLLTLLMAVLLLPAIEAPHRIGPGSRTPKVGSFAHRGGGSGSPDHRTRDSRGQATGRGTSVGKGRGQRMRETGSPPPSLPGARAVAGQEKLGGDWCVGCRRAQRGRPGKTEAERAEEEGGFSPCQRAWAL